MDTILHITMIAILLLITSLLVAETVNKPIIHVFHKHKGPSLKALEQINKALAIYADKYEIQYFDIEDEANLEKIIEFGLPATHFPVAVVIDGRFSIQRGDRIISFVHFPTFMKGIGRHEGNWSIDDLSAALKDNSIFLDKNILPELETEDSEGECE